MLDTWNGFLPDESASEQLGCALASCLQAPLVMYLEGDLGAGKTTVTRGVLRGLGFQGVVKSPTYAIVESYELAQFSLHHFDLYRFNSPEEWEDSGLDELIDNSVCMVEWADKGEGFVPKPDMVIQLTHQQTGRLVRFVAHTENGLNLLTSWKKSLQEEQ